MATEYGIRLRRARKHAGLTQTALSEKTGIAQSTISTAEREGQGSSDTPVYAQACSVDALWLATGKGEMLPSTESPPPQVSLPTPSPEAIRLGEWLDKIKDPEKHYRAAHAAMAVLIRAVDGPPTTPNQVLQAKKEKRRDERSKR